jgi:penicillin amidase
MLRAFVLTASLPLLCLLPHPAQAAAGWSSLDVAGEEVRIFRDEFGRPRIFAKTNRGLFTAYGYAVAEDRLWQLELNRRASRCRLAEIFGAGFVATDTLLRTVGYTDAELDAQLDALAAPDRLAFDAYAAGINRYVAAIGADPIGRLPFEFWALGGTVPAAWTARDAAGVAAFIISRFSDSGGRELDNARILQKLIARHGAAKGFAIFDDLRWLDDAASPVTIRRLDIAQAGKRVRRAVPSYVPSAVPETAHHEAHERLRGMPIPGKLGSYGWVVSPAKSAEGHAMLYGGPQMEYSAPEIVHEVQLTSEEGYHVAGMAIAGIPFVVIGRNDHLSWTLTTGLAADNVDIYLESLCGSLAGGYTFKSERCRSFEVRFETIAVRGAAAVTLPVLRSVHGPVVGVIGTSAATVKRAQWMTELDSVARLGAMGRAGALHEFSAAVRGVSAAFNVLYADTAGNIAYWFVGRNPVRAAGFDPRLPLPGDGAAEWSGEFRPVLSSLNPSRGWLANWNNKATADYPGGDADLFGKIYRLNDLEPRFNQRSISLEDMRDIPRDIARVKGRTGRDARFLKPYLFDALDRAQPTHALAAQAKQVLKSWDGSMFADAVRSGTLEAGEVIFAAWLARTVEAIFGEALGDLLGAASPDRIRASEGTSNMLLHLLDHVLGEGSQVPPNLDYLNGRDPNEIMSAAFDQVLAELVAAQGADPARWTAARAFTDFNHPIVGRVARIPESNRATYAQIVQLRPSGIEAENIYTLGQSGFLHFLPSGGFALDAHFLDQNELYRNFEYKNMPLQRD